MLALLFPPFELWWLAPLVLLPILSLLSRTKRPLAGAAMGLLFGVGMGLACWAWLFPTLTAEFHVARKVALAVAVAAVATTIWPFAVFGGLTVWMGRSRWISWLTPCLAWGAAEWLRVVGISPWMRLGDALAGRDVWVQPAAVGGVALLSFGIVATNALLFEAWQRRRLRAALAAAMLLAGWGAFGAIRLALHPLDDTSLRVGLVQVATPQHERWTEGSWERNLERQLRLSEQAQAEGAELIVWSETAIDTVPQQIPDLAARLGRRLEADLVTGLLLERPDGRLTNSVAAFDSDGRRLGHYDKRVLVPLVEELPDWVEARPRLRRRLRRLAAETSYARGESSEPLDVAGFKLGALVCYEAMFPELSRRTVELGAEILVNVSNDAFFPKRAAAQHAAMGLMRSVELGRPFLRASNRGPGFVVDAAGRILSRVGAGEQVARVVDLDPATIDTLYARGGHGFDEALFGAALLSALMVGRRPRSEGVADSSSNSSASA
ncbi:MAG: apolipoprotein N-acyltransferase [Deltaproteobacteria bacterium]|nr:apolipoprotein N-acyltransferase [Deltaproteobacteria bacterium]MBW2397367.1 apolipoprotein N-acyltransferase [Deltaproteobacteria bacterium]